MKFLTKSIAATLALTCVLAVAGTLDYEAVTGGDMRKPIIYRFFDNEAEIGYRVIAGIQMETCAQGFIKLSKTNSQEFVIFTETSKLQGCTQRRYLFKVGDNSKGRIQSIGIDGEYSAASDFWEAKDKIGIKPSLTLKQ